MKPPGELLDTLNRYEDINSALTVYREASGYIKAFSEVRQAALDLCQSQMALDGAIHHKSDAGACGWTRPKTAKLDKARWAEMVRMDPALKAIQDQADIAQARLEQAQDEAGAMILPAGRFYIK